ncbi:AbrB/MazE/SpoVT family DNA-binding domain-containing protein [Brevibacillus sp. HD3.3A]|uniref:AbrB/MazE/SpoVT family DNA-binding domain-containing protein n=1 Tax=Brevibacillus sp. HD3.3A TaxID=2738979 RepID=UPI00156B7350|nr:AbrB/MazE/SpoVT family DNA-binding domain-containing protein [Brevibacillus sp. HD3.3A]UED70735.1 AbrB/MazE/SpoVT family DNA-binding domain-containing protein [Brevibacillus sp. HD3.3A]
MKATGIVRKIDHLGRIVLPKELRDTFRWKTGTPLEVYVDGETVVLREYAPGCTLCGEVDTPMTSLYPQKQICTACVDIIAKDQDNLKRAAGEAGGEQRD